MVQELKIVPVDQIPKGEDVPLDNLVAVFRVCTAMEKICIDKKGAGLSAVQVGIPWKLFLISCDDHHEYYLNCEYEGLAPKRKSIEGCLSLRNSKGELRYFDLERFAKVRIRGKQLKIGDQPSLYVEDVDREIEGFQAVVFQHEIDHQNGILISDIGREIEIM